MRPLPLECKRRHNTKTKYTDIINKLKECGCQDGPKANPRGWGNIANHEAETITSNLNKQSTTHRTVISIQLVGTKATAK